MSDRREETGSGATGGADARAFIREVIEEYLKGEALKAEPAHRAELLEERKRREQLERRLNEVIEENNRNRRAAEEAERQAAIRGELQRLGVTKIELAFRAAKDEVQRGEDGSYIARGERGPVGLREYLTQFVNDNPELLPARNLGGSGATAAKTPPEGAAVELEKIKPGMSAEEFERARREIARIASQTLYAG